MAIVMKTRFLFIGLCVLFTVACFAREKKPPAPTCNLSFVVVRDYNGKPVHNAAIVLHAVGSNDKQARSGGLELKTNAEGTTNFDGIPYGKLRVQVLAQGFQTFGEDYDVQQPEMQITVKLKRPEGQFSIYTDPPKPDTPAQPNSNPRP